MPDVDERPRLTLLRSLASLRDYERKHGYDKDEYWPKFTPLFGATTWPYDADDMVLACRESEKLGHIEVKGLVGTERVLFGWMLRITDAGYDYIRARDLVGEVRQEALAPNAN